MRLLHQEVNHKFESKLKYAHFSRIRDSLRQYSLEEPHATLRVLDMACGPGNMGLFSEGIANVEWYGLELWPSELRQAAQSGAYLGLIQANLIENLPLRASSADAIVLNEILMYLGNASRLLAELFDILKPSGILYVYNPIYTIPNFLSFFKKIGRRIYQSREAVSFDRQCDWKIAARASRINFYSFDSLLEEIQAAGFKIQDVSGFRIFRNRIRLMRNLEKYRWYRETTKRLAKSNPRLASDVLVISRKEPHRPPVV